MKNKLKWKKKRHYVVFAVAKFLLWPVIWLKYNVQIEKLNDDRPYLILYNHQTPSDQFMLAYTTSEPIYYVATEDIFSTGWLSRIMTWGVNPIPIKKSGNDLRAVKNCMRVAKEGGTIAIAPEGNRTYSGETCYIKPSIVKLIRALNLPVAFYNFEGGYGKQPRWSNYTRSGKMKLVKKSVYEPEVFNEISDEELYEVVKRELYHDDSEYRSLNFSKKSAENLERVIYVCPVCGMSSFKSNGSEFTCEKCGLTVEYTEDKNFVKDGEIFEFNNIRDWYRYQEDRINKLDISKYENMLLYEDITNVFEVIPYKKKMPVFEKASLNLYGNKVGIKGQGQNEDFYLFSDIEHMAVCGRNKLNIYFKDFTYQFKGDVSFNPVKYLNLYYRYRNQMGLSTGVDDPNYLGL